MNSLITLKYNLIDIYERLVFGVKNESWAANWSDQGVRLFVNTLVSLIVLCIVALISVGVFFVPNVLASPDPGTPTSPALEACLQDPAAVWLAKKTTGGTITVDVTQFTYPPQGGKLRIESALLFRSLLDELKAGSNPDAFYKNMVIAQADAWDADQNIASGEFEAHVDTTYWRTFWDNAIVQWGQDPALVYHDVLCVDLPTKTQMSSVVAATLFNSIEDMVAKVPGFTPSDFNPATSPVNQLALAKVVELNCTNLRLPGPNVPEVSECVTKFTGTTLSGQELVEAIRQFYSGALPVTGTTTPTPFPTIAVTVFPQGINATQAANYGQIYTNIVSECGEDDERCIGAKWDELAFTFSDNVISQINERCSDLDYCRGLVVLYRMQGYDENRALQMALERITEANTLPQSQECTWDQVTSNTCVTGATMYYVYNEGAGVDTALALDAGGGIIDTIGTVSGVPYDTSRSHLVPIPTSSSLYGLYTDPYGNMKGGIIVSRSPMFSGSTYYNQTSSMNGYSCYDEQPFYQTQVGSMWVYPSSIGPLEQCSPVIQPATAVPSGGSSTSGSNNQASLPPLEAGLVAQGANMSSSIVLSMDCSNAMADGNFYFQGSGYNLSIHNSYLPSGTCGQSDKFNNNTIYIATGAGRSSVSVGTGWTRLSGESNLYWAKRWQ